jgi:hypothetical protein
LAPIAGPIVVRGAKPGDVVAIDLIELTPFGVGKSAILRDFGVLRREFREPMALSSPVPDRRAWFGGRPHSAATQPQSRHDLDDAARRLQALIRRRLRRRFRPKGRRSG